MQPLNPDFDALNPSYELRTLKGWPRVAYRTTPSHASRPVAAFARLRIHGWSFWSPLRSGHVILGTIDS